MKFNTIRSRITLIQALLGVFLVLALSALFYVNTRMHLIDERTKVVTLEVEAEQVFIEREFSKVYENTQALSLVVMELVENNIAEDSREYLIDLAKDIVEENPNITAVRYVMEDDFIEHDSKYAGDDRFRYDGRFITYVGETVDGLSVKYIDNYQELEFYTRSIETEVDFFTEPFKSEINVGDAYLSTVVFPVKINGEYKGLVGIDFSSAFINEQMASFQESFERRDLIVSQSGTIIINTQNTADSGKHISQIHDHAEEAIQSMDLYDSYVEHLPNGHLEVLYAIDLGSTGEHWYIFSDIEESNFVSDINRELIFILALGGGALVLSIIVVAITNGLSLKPLEQMTGIIDEFEIERDSVDDVEIDTRNLKDVQALYDVFKDTVTTIQQSIQEKQIEATNQERQLAINTNAQQSKDIEELSNALALNLVENSNAIYTGLYVIEEDKLILKGSYGLDKSVQHEYDFKEGVIGSVAVTQKHLILNSGEFTQPLVDVGTNKALPNNIIVYPVVFEGNTIGVYGIGTMKDPQEIIEYLDSVNNTVSLTINRQLVSDRVEKLYVESKKLAEDLELNQEELNSRNEELQAQQEELRVTNEELQAQQEELRVTNEEMQNHIGQMSLMNKRLEDTKLQLQERTLEAENSNKFKSEFLANMSHELRTPLNSILILSNLIKEEQAAPVKSREYADTINSAGKDLLELINGILDLSKIESGKEDINLNEMNLNDLLDDLDKRYGVIAKDKGIELNIDHPRDVIGFTTDETKVKLIITNLLSNALKFTEVGRVNLKVKNNANEVIVQVEDSGIGIKPEDIDSIFEEFKQLDSNNNRRYAGTGLGLAICKRYSILLHGRLTVESTYGEGSTFTLVLPKHAFDKDSSVKVEVKKRTTDEDIVIDDRHTIRPNEHSILIIDDDASLLKTYRDYFNAKGIPIIVTETGENGLFLADYYKPSLIIIDYNLPRVNGQEVVNKLQSNHRTSDIPFILISGDDRSEEFKDYEFYQKPVENTTLDDIVKKVKTISDVQKRILIIEDNINQLNALVEYINKNNVASSILIETASTKEQAMNQLNSKIFSLIVADLGLEDANEFELIEEIKKNKRHSNIPIIVYTGKVISVEQEEYLSQYVNDIIIKGDKSPERLISDIKLYIQSHEAQTHVTDKNLFKDRTVLVVDDDIRNIFALTGLLESYNINVVYDTAGQDALDRLSDDNNINLVIMDIMMPEMDGYEATRRIRNMKEYRNLPIIALTAKSMRGDRQKCIDAGATEYLSKPLDESKLLSVLRVWL